MILRIVFCCCVFFSGTGCESNFYSVLLVFCCGFLDPDLFNKWLIVGLGRLVLWGSIRGTPKVAKPFHFRGSQESKPPGPKPTIYPLADLYLRYKLLTGNRWVF